MKLLRASSLLVLALVLYSANAKRYTGGGSSRGSSSGSRISWGGISKPKTPSRPISAPTSFHTSDGKTSSKTFLQSESSKPHTPTSFSPPPVRSGSHQSVPHPTGSQHASAPPAHHANNHGSGLVHEQHRQSSSSDVNSNPYAKQPAYNPHAPYVPSGGYGNPTSGSHLPPPPSGISVPTQNNLHSPHSPPYPTNQPNHPHPDHNIRPSTSFPSHSPPPYSPGPIQPHSYPNSHYAPPPYHPGSYNPYASPPGYHAPPSYAHAPPAYQAPSAPFVPGRTVYVIPESHKSSSGPGLGTYIASGVAGGVAAGATNAIVDHAISSIFRSNPSHVHTYPSAPPVGTPTSSVTNNYYYGSNGAPPADGGSAPPVSGAPTGQSAQPGAPSVIGGTTGQSGQSVGPPRLGQTVAPTGQDPPLPVPGQTLEFGTAPPPPMNPVVGTTNPGSDGQGNPSSATNGAVSKTPENQPEIPPPFIEVSDENLMKLTEELFDKQDKNLNQYVELNLQKRVTNVEPDKPVPDEAPEPLFNLKPELDSIPTITALRALYDNYQRDGWQKENLTPERRNEEDAFLDEIIKTPVMSKALDWLAEHKYIESDNFEKKDALRRMWFTTFNDTSSGFERIFLSEKFGDSGIIGMQNWLYFAHLESQKNVNYLGYVDQTSLSGKGSLLKLNYQTEGFTIQNATIFVGTAPELELSLYTVCFYARFNKWCPISIGGAKFFILTHSFRSFGKDIIDIGFPAF